MRADIAKWGEVIKAQAFRGKPSCCARWLVPLHVAAARGLSICGPVTLVMVLLLSWGAAAKAATVNSIPQPGALTGSCNPAEQEQAAIATLNQMRREPAAAGQALGINLAGVSPRPALSPNAILAKVARERAEDMAARHYFGHVDPDGIGANQKVVQAGYPLPSFYLGNPANNFIESISAGRQSGRAAIEALIVDRGAATPGHRIHLLGLNDFYGKHTEIGVGFVCDPRSQYKYYTVVLTAYPEGRSAATTSPAAKPAAPVPVPAPAVFNDGQVRPMPDMARQFLLAHNQWRQRVGVAPLQWSAELAAYAQQWASQSLANGRFSHREGGAYGENFFMARGRPWSAGEVVNRWASEARNYNHASNSCQGVCGHYTQIVWRGTTHVGCGVARSADQEIWVCNYNPPGNFVGERPY